MRYFLVGTALCIQDEYGKTERICHIDKFEYEEKLLNCLNLKTLKWIKEGDSIPLGSKYIKSKGIFNQVHLYEVPK